MKGTEGPCSEAKGKRLMQIDSEGGSTPAEAPCRDVRERILPPSASGWAEGVSWTWAVSVTGMPFLLARSCGSSARELAFRELGVDGAGCAVAVTSGWQNRLEMSRRSAPPEAAVDACRAVAGREAAMLGAMRAGAPSARVYATTMWRLENELQHPAHVRLSRHRTYR